MVESQTMKKKQESNKLKYLWLDGFDCVCGEVTTK